MASASFRFQQFEVFHNRCGMKVGTDGVLLGAWVEPTGALRILDVGTGSGLIALILAQRSNARLVGVELDAEAASQAAENARNAPFSNRIRIETCDFNNFSDEPFDLIVSNPPFFQRSLQAPGRARNAARHDVALTFTRLVEHAAKLLTQSGRFAVIIPYEQLDAFAELAFQQHLFLSRQCDVIPVHGKQPKRVLLEFSRERVKTERTCIVLANADGTRSNAYSALTKELYLKD